METNSLKFTVIVCSAIAIVQTIFLIIPVGALSLYNMLIQPLVYVALGVAVYVFMGNDKRPIPKAYTSNITAILSIAVFCIVTLVISILFGMGSNVMANNLNLVARNLWEIGLLIVIGEYIRFRLIKSANPLNRPVIAFALTIILAYGQMDGIRMLLGGDVILWAIFFESVFRHLIISAVVTYISIKGSLASMVLISFFYTMLPFLAPVIPDITPIAFSLISGAMAFVTGIIYHFVSNEKSQDVRKREKRVIKYGRKPILFNTGYALVLVLIGAFFVGLFPIYPIAVLTDSMEPTLERGTLVFIERVSPGEAFNKVDEGQVIHFESRNRVEFIHRVVDFSHDSDGERVYITQGDAVEIIDPHPVPQDNVLGIARASIPFLGYPYLAFRAIVGALQ